MINYILQGKVVKGEGVGRKIGFPTANLKLAQKPKFKRGVYAALVTLAGRHYLGLAYWGRRYIFKEKQDNFEVYILNFKRSIYDKKLKVKLLKFLRGPRRVTKLAALRKLLRSDIEKLKGFVVLVDRNDQLVGLAEGKAAHQGEGKLHRAFSVFLFNKKRELLLQKRSRSKQLWPLTWANSCCSHPFPGETYLRAANRRVKEELGLEVKLKVAGRFIYRARDGRRGAEYELDTVLIGKTDKQPKVNQKEIAQWSYGKLTDLPGSLAPWVKPGLKKINLSDIFKA